MRRGKPFSSVKGETIIEGVCAMALLLIALSIITKAAWLAITLIRAADKNDSAYYTALSEPRTTRLSITIDCGGNLYTEHEYEAAVYRNSAGFIYFDDGGG